MTLNENRLSIAKAETVVSHIECSLICKALFYGSTYARMSDGYLVVI